MRISLACNESLGVKCQIQCNVHCINQTCDRTDGSCLYGCEDGHQCVDGVDGIYLISMSFRKIFYIIMYIDEVVINPKSPLHWINDTNDFI